MPKKFIEIDLKEKLETYYNNAKARGEDNTKILDNINNMLKDAGHVGYTSKKSLYNLVNSFGSVKQPIDKILDVNKSITKSLDKEVASKLKAIGEFDMNLSWQNDMTRDMAARLYKRFITIDERGDKAGQKDLIEFARATKEFIDLGVKIDALNAKKIDVNNPDNKTQIGIAVYVNENAAKRLEEVSASVIDGGFITPQAPAQLSEASYG